LKKVLSISVIKPTDSSSGTIVSVVTYSRGVSPGGDDKKKKKN
jgi:hypothetical protein